MKNKELRELTATEIEKKLREQRDELLQLRLRKQTGQLEKTHTLKESRRTIARLETVLRQKKAS